MKKIIGVLILVTFSLPAKSDVIFNPFYYAYFNYSAELVYGYEIIKDSKISNIYWGGIGVVGPLFLKESAIGIEIAAERRRYFKSDQYKRFFISSYAGLAFMNDFEYRNSLGFVPGIKLNYRSQINENLVLEPYISLSLPISIDLKYKDFYPIIPIATIGFRLGINTIKYKN